MRLAEKFNISHRQAQRDIDRLRSELGAPLAYSKSNKGFYYTAKFSLPSFVATENDPDYSDILSGVDMLDREFARSAAIQMQIPYTATLEIRDKLTVMNMRPFIVAQRPRHMYECEFQSVEMFLGAIISMDSDIRIVSPDWLREKLVLAAQRVLRNN
jgi:predicted DNA-binding transcriptional regulator YafY